MKSAEVTDVYSEGMAKSAMRVGIVGAGIGGLSLALALRERGLQADVFEQAPELTEIGAAIALSANAIREFARLGLAGELAAASTIPTELIYRHWRDGSRIAAHPVRQNDWYEKQFGAPYFGIHRADLQTILSSAYGVEHLHLGCRLVNIIEQADSVVLEFANGRTHKADLVVGADGVRSTVRRWITGADDVVYSGTSAFRGIVPTENLPSLPDPHAIQFWMGPDGHLLHYAIGPNGESVNFFAVVETPSIWLQDGSVAEVQDEVPVASFRGWHPAVTEMIRAAASPIRWGLFTVRPLLRWYRDRVVILGDAAHGMLPHHGQGANTSIEDAFSLAGLLAKAPGDDLEATFSRFQALRRARTRKIQRSSWVTSSLLHLPDGPAAQARNQKVAAVPRDFGWIHEYDVQQALQASGAAAAGSGTRQQSRQEAH
jgi:salicylate hydroxylase